MCKNDLHPANDHSSIELTEEGIIISFNDEQFLKTEFQIFATDWGIFIFVKDEQLKKAFSLIATTDGGITILVNDLHSSNEIESTHESIFAYLLSLFWQNSTFWIPVIKTIGNIIYFRNSCNIEINSGDSDFFYWY